MKIKYLWLVLVLQYASLNVLAQPPATSTTIVGIGRGTCTGGTNGVQQFTYNASTNTLTQSGSICQPALRTQSFSISRSVISYNPKDQMLYYFRRVPNGSVFDTYVWRWAPGTCPTSGTVRDPIATYLNEYLTVAFDAAGNGWMMKLVPNGTTPATHSLTMRKVDFTTSTFGPEVPVSLPAGVTIVQTNGDYLITPGGNMFMAYDNKLLTINYQDYGLSSLQATFIGNIQIPSADQNLVGLAYADGEFIGSFVKTTATAACGYGEVNILTGERSSVTLSGGTFTSFDNTSVTSGIGVAKKFVSATPTSNSGEYDVIYDVFVKNYGGFPISNLQVVDDLRLINSAGNLVSASAQFINNPAGITLNSSYNGNTVRNLLAAGQVLKNSPLSENHFTIRIQARVRGIINGRIYENSATATGTGFGGVSLSDISTNGVNPDLNLNEKPDDVGEDIKTPFVITVASETPPCSQLANVLHRQDFNLPNDQAVMPTSSTSQYTGSTLVPLPNESFVITNNPSVYNPSYWNSISDHGGGGRMLVVNADIRNNVVYSKVLTGLCAGTKYSFSAWIASISNSSQVAFCNAVGGFKMPKLNFRVRDQSTGLVLTSISTGEISNSNWVEYGMRFVMPSGFSSIIIEIINEGEGGCGNDLAIDDIQFGTCDAAPQVSVSAVSAGCIGSSTTMSANLSDAGVIPGAKEYQWQVSTDNTTFTDITGATGATYTIAAITTTDVNKYYRVVVAATGNMNSVNCRYTSPGFLLSAKTPSTAPTAILRNRTVLCPGEPVTLRASGGTLGSNAVYRWYSGTCGGTLVGTGQTITVNPSVATTYYVRIEGDCNTTACISTTITFNCDLDADKDGITDVAESGGVDPKLDDDFDGTPNWRDAQYPGFADANGDGVNDNFDSDRDGVPNFLDRDSDGDGIPDVVESGGADANGDGRIDGFTDSDNDGLSDNVDANLSGHLSSGPGLGLLDTDGDGIPNYIDLDSDNDGIPDVVEVYGTDANNDGMLDFTGTFAANDTDGDGFLNAVDGDADGNGTVENSNGPLLKTGAALSNGRASAYPFKNMDADTNANPYDLDSDGDGIADVIEAGFADANFDGQADGGLNAKGWNVAISSRATLALPNTDGTGRVNAYDIDADDDGIPDNVEGQPTDIYTLPAGLDADGDGIDDKYDIIAGFGGKGINPVDTDGDLVPDYIDTDADSDGVLDIVEGNDFNLNRISDDDIALTGIDTDGDGLDDKFDADNSSANATVRYMGNNGSLNGPLLYGSRAMVQKSVAAYYDRDWRLIGYALNFNLLNLTATLRGDGVLVSWHVKGAHNAVQFEVQRSADGQHFAGIKTIAGKSTGAEIEQYATTDDLPRAQFATAYYRIKMLEADGKYKFSSIVSVKQPAQPQITFFPNPVDEWLTISLGSRPPQSYKVELTDMQGRVVYRVVKMVNSANAEIKVDMRTWKPQTYILKISNDKSEFLKTQKIIKR